MTLIQDVQSILKRLAGRGWRELLLKHDKFDITLKDLATELARPLNVDRSLPGFEDFSPDGKRGIEPGIPAQSLLYHALASPLVHPQSTSVAPSPEDYPTLEELDTIENYIFATARKKLSDFPDALIAVFAYQYRTMTRSPHGLFADMAYSRAGVARVGTAQEHYDSARRSFWVVPTGGGDSIAVLPARYAAFLAIPRKPRPGDVILQEEDVDDRDRLFLFPVHKLFPGTECLADASANLKLAFSELHRNEKLQLLHTEGELTVVSGFDINKPPFIRESGKAGDLVSLRQAGASVVLVPKGTAPLVRSAKQRNAKTGRDEFVRFVVPPEKGENRFWTSYQTINQVDDFHRIGRVAPGYVNIRHRVVTAADGTQTIEDLNQTIQKEKDFLTLVSKGRFEAAHFIDDTCDGCVAVKVTGMPKKLRTRAAYSLVTAPDFFPLVDQLAISDWVKHKLGDKREQFDQGEPWPLSDGRHPANLKLALPDGSGPAFSRDDNTIMAVVGNLKAATPRPGLIPNALDTSVSFLPDGASNEFEPGWDITLAQDDKGMFYTAYGLGSPFPEDSKLCAALNSFWPAVAPDATRTFGLAGSPTAIPLLDVELGHHPNHPRVRAGEITSRRGWDGEFGPFLEDHNETQSVNCANKDRSDYTSNAEAGLLRVSLLSAISSAELIARMEALRACIVRALPPTNAPGEPLFVSTTKYFLVAAEGIDDWATRPDRGNPGLSGKGYLFVFVLLDNSADQPTDEPHRRRFGILPGAVFTAQVTTAAVCWRQGNGQFQFVNVS